MAQQNEPAHSLDPSTVPGKRKRGRPRKDDIPGTEHGGRTQRRRRNPHPTKSQGLVGQSVSGILDGVFDAGFLITVRVGSGPLLRGMVFDPRLSVPVSAENDVAPHIKMSTRDEIPFPAESLQKRGPTVPSPITNKAVNHDSQGSAFGFKSSEGAISGMQSIFSKEAGPVTSQVPDNQWQTGQLEMDSSSKGSEGNEAPGGAKAGHTSQTIPDDEASGQQKPCSTSQRPHDNETTGEQSLGSASQTPPAYEAAGELKTETPVEVKLDSTCQIPPGTETDWELKACSTGHATSVDGPVGEPNLGCASEVSPLLQDPLPVPEPDLKELEIQNTSDKVKSSASEFDFTGQL